MEKWLPSTKMYCKNEQIEVEMAEERHFEMRMTEFLLRGLIRSCSDGGDKRDSPETTPT